MRLVCLCILCLRLLPIQELHERPQHGVGICLCCVVVGGAFDLVQDLRHLTHAAGDASLKAAGRRAGLRQDDRRAAACENALRHWTTAHACVSACVRVC